MSSAGDIFGSILPILGGIGGFFLGGPAGAMAGVTLGGALGSAVKGGDGGIASLVNKEGSATDRSPPPAPLQRVVNTPPPNYTHGVQDEFGFFSKFDQGGKVDWASVANATAPQLGPVPTGIPSVLATPFDPMTYGRTPAVGYTPPPPRPNPVPVAAPVPASNAPISFAAPGYGPMATPMNSAWGTGYSGSYGGYSGPGAMSGADHGGYGYGSSADIGGFAYAGGGRVAPLGTGERFRALSGELKDKGATNPDALAAWIGRRKYGPKKFAALGHAKGGPVRGNDEKDLADWVDAHGNEMDEGMIKKMGDKLNAKYGAANIARENLRRMKEQPDWLQRNLGFAEGGEVLTDPISIYEAAVAALKGENPNPEPAIRAFIEKFGLPALKKLQMEIGSDVAGAMAAGMPPGTLQQGMNGAPKGMENTGQSDSIPATIDGRQPAALSRGEYVVPADAVSALGDGSTDSGAERLDQIVGQIRNQAHGKTAQQRPVNPARLMR